MFPVLPSPGISEKYFRDIKLENVILNPFSLENILNINGRKNKNILRTTCRKDLIK